MAYKLKMPEMQNFRVLAEKEAAGVLQVKSGLLLWTRKGSETTIEVPIEDFITFAEQSGKPVDKSAAMAMKLKSSQVKSK